MSNRFFGVIVPLILIACGRHGETGSTVKHLWSEAKREPEGELMDCGPESKEDNKQFGPQGQYLTKIGQYIMGRNPDVFLGPYAGDLFCFTLRKVGFFGAEAAISSRHVMIYDNTLYAAVNDAQVAAIIAHELAHVTMQAQNSGTAPQLERESEWVSARQKHDNDLQAIEVEQKALSETVIKNRTRILDLNDAIAEKAEGVDPMERTRIQNEIKRLVDAIALSQKLLPSITDPNQREAAEKKIKEMTTDLTAKKTTLSAVESKEQAAAPQEFTERAHLESEIETASNRREILTEQTRTVNLELDRVTAKFMSPEEQANWAEQLADEVGYRFYLTAGFAASEYNWGSRRGILKIKGEEALQKCDADVKASITDMSRIPQRGSDAHPDFCWRIYDTEVKEFANHRTELEPLIRSAHGLTVFEGELKAVQP